MPAGAPHSSMGLYVGPAWPEGRQEWHPGQDEKREYWGVGAVVRARRQEGNRVFWPPVDRGFVVLTSEVG